MESAVTMAVSPTSMRGTLRSRAWGGQGQRDSGTAQPGKVPILPPPTSSLSNLDDVAVAQGEHQLWLLLYPCAILQRHLQLHGDHLPLSRSA